MNRNDDPGHRDAMASRATPSEAVLAQAVEWHLASENDAMDWDGFTLWLEADPAHRHAFDQIALTDRALEENHHVLATVEAPLPANDADDGALVAARRPAHWRWAGTALAASLVALLVVSQVRPPAPRTWQTGGAIERIALADGSTIVLGPHSTLTVTGRGEEDVALTGGAFFDIRHDPARQLTITAGGATISDIGTRFDVQADGGAVRVAVAEGQVEVGAEALSRPVRLTAGRALSFDAQAGSAVVASARTGDVGGWQQGRLSYANATLALVVADLRRYAGVSVELPAALRNRRFSGTLIVDDGDKTLHDLAELMGVGLAGGPGHWRLVQPGG